MSHKTYPSGIPGQTGNPIVRNRQSIITINCPPHQKHHFRLPVGTRKHFVEATKLYFRRTARCKVGGGNIVRVGWQFGAVSAGSWWGRGERCGRGCWVALTKIYRAPADSEMKRRTASEQYTGGLWSNSERESGNGNNPHYRCLRTFIITLLA